MNQFSFENILESLSILKFFSTPFFKNRILNIISRLRVKIQLFNV